MQIPITACVSGRWEKKTEKYYFLSSFHIMKIAQQPCSRGSLEYRQSEITGFFCFFCFLYTISFRTLLFENIWPVTIYGTPRQKHSGALLPCITVLFFWPLENTRRGSIVHVGLITYCGV